MSSSLPNREIVLFVLGELGATTARIDTEREDTPLIKASLQRTQTQNGGQQ